MLFLLFFLSLISFFTFRCMQKSPKSVEAFEEGLGTSTDLKKTNPSILEDGSDSKEDGVVDFGLPFYLLFDE